MGSLSLLQHSVPHVENQGWDFFPRQQVNITVNQEQQLKALKIIQINRSSLKNQFGFLQAGLNEAISPFRNNKMIYRTSNFARK